MTAVEPYRITVANVQAKVLASTARFRVWVAGRRSGKSFCGGLACLESALEHPNSDTWYTYPTFKGAKKSPWRNLKKICAPYVIKTNESDLTLTLYNGSRITLVGREAPDNLRGEGLVRMVNDEFAVQEKGDKGKQTWEEVLQPMLADTGGDAIFITTPKGYNWGYDLFERGQDPDASDWESWQSTTLESGRVKPEVIEAAKRDTDPRSFAQEWEASFTKLADRVYDYFERDEHIDADVQDTGAELLIGMDFNVNPMTFVVAVNAGGAPHILDSLEVASSNTEEVADEIKARYPDRKIIICPDPSCIARKTSAPAGQTDFTILKRAGFTIQAPNAAPPVPDRINNTQSNLRTADGNVRMKVHPRAKSLIRALEGLTYKPGTSQPDKDSPHIHTTDAVGYLLWQEFNLLTPKARSFKFRI